MDVSQPASGKVECSPDGTCLYTPEEGFVGEDTFFYQASNGDGKDSSEVSVEVSAAPSKNDGEGSTEDEWDILPVPEDVNVDGAEQAPWVGKDEETGPLAAVYNRMMFFDIGTAALLPITLLSLVFSVMAWKNSRHGGTSPRGGTTGRRKRTAASRPPERPTE